MKIIQLLILLSIITQAHAIELSLEENRAQRGNLGYVDLQRLFAASPDAKRAKENFADLVRQAEERVNSRKADLVKLRRDLEDLRAERDKVAKAPIPTVTPAPAVSKAAAVSVSTEIVKDGHKIALPGMSDVAASSQTATVAVATQTVTPAPAAAPTMTQGQQLLELDSKIISLQSDIARRESDLANEKQDADRGLLAVESLKTDQVLARIYRAINDVARQEGVSVVVDKSSILYGHSAVDLTDRVLKKLREQQ